MACRRFPDGTELQPSWCPMPFSSRMAPPLPRLSVFQVVSLYTTPRSLPGGASMLHIRSGTSVETIRNHDGMRPSPLCAGAAVPQGKLRGVTRCWAAHCNLAEMMAQLGKSRDGGTGRAVVRCPEGRPPGHPPGACISAKEKNPRSAAQPLIPGSRVVSRTHISVADCMTVKIEGFSMVPSGRVKEYAKGLHVGQRTFA